MLCFQGFSLFFFGNKVYFYADLFGRFMVAATVAEMS